VKIVVGLGNPGVKYASTPHNIGFEAVDAIASEIGADWQEKRQYKCLWAKGVLNGEQVILVKPQTFMNLSGVSVASVVKYSNSTPSDLIVIHDDIDLALGRLRVRSSGSCGGHNGIRNIIENLASADFVRIKLGVGKDKSDVISHVLGKFSPEARAVADKLVSATSSVVSSIIKGGAQYAMNTFNSFNASLL
jgi:PTH1 family peptidyl-tRNA hydrolase